MASSKKLLEAAQEREHAEQAVAHRRVIDSLQAQNRLLVSQAKIRDAEVKRLEDDVARILEMEAAKRHAKFTKLLSKPGAKSSPIVVLNDWHSEEKVDPDTVGGLNKFNLEIAAKRIRHVFQKIPILLDSLGPFFGGLNEQLILALLGDMITGYIHPELRESNYLSPGEALLFVQDQLCEGIDFLLREKVAKTLLLPCVDGNHGRTTEKMRVSTRHENSNEWLLYHQLAKLYRHEPRIAFKIDKDIHNIVPVQGRKVRFQHGDAISYQGGVGGISIPVNKAIAAWNISERVDLDVFAHWHQSIQTEWWVCCNCLIGPTAYARKIKAAFSKPAQTLIVMSKEHGKVLAMNIHCE